MSGGCEATNLFVTSPIPISVRVRSYTEVITAEPRLQDALHEDVVDLFPNCWVFEAPDCFLFDRKGPVGCMNRRNESVAVSVILKGLGN